MHTRRKHMLWRSIARTLLITGVLVASFPCNLVARTDSVRIDTIEVPISPDFIKILPESTNILAISNREKKIIRFDLEAKTVLGRADVDYNVTDIVIDVKGRYAYLIGQRVEEGNEGYISRFDVKNDVIRTIKFSERLEQPKIAVDDSGRLFIGDQISSVVKMVAAESFDGQIGPFLPADAARIAFLKRGPVASIGVTWDGKFLFVSHIGTAAISMVDLRNGETLSTFDMPQTGTKSGRPYSLVVASGYSSKKAGQTSVVLGTEQDDALVVFDLDPRFRSLDVVQFVKLRLGSGISRPPGQERYGRQTQLLIASDTDQHAIVVGSLGSRQIVVFGRQDKVIERKGEFDLPAEALYLDVARGGDLGVIIDNRRSMLSVIRWSNDTRPVRGWKDTAPARGADDLRTAQRLLAIQGYPIGAVDGIDGPQTRRAVALFQESSGLKSTGIVDALTLSTLHETTIATLRAGLSDASRESNPLYWANVQRTLGRSLLALGERDAKTDRLEEAIASFRAALEVFKADAQGFVDSTSRDLARAQALLQERQRQ
jgi:6-phosphogluconolactonase (cycloisomerase 2 family)